MIRPSGAHTVCACVCACVGVCLCVSVCACVYERASTSVNASTRLPIAVAVHPSHSVLSSISFFLFAPSLFTILFCSSFPFPSFVSLSRPVCDRAPCKQYLKMMVRYSQYSALAQAEGSVPGMGSLLLPHDPSSQPGARSLGVRG